MTRNAALAPWGAGVAWLIAIGGVVATLVLIANIDPAYRSVDAYLLVFLTLPLTFGTVGAAIARRRPGHYAGWTLLVTGVAFSLELAGVAYSYAGLPPSPRHLPGAEIAVWLTNALFVPSTALMVTVFLLLFPDGRLPGPRWRVAAGLSLVSIAVYTVVEVIRPGPLNEDIPSVTSPIAVPAELSPAIELVSDAANLGVTVGVLLAGLSVLVRYRRSGERERVQIKWIAWLGSGMGVVFLIALLQAGPISDVAFLTGFGLIAALPIVVAIAILRYRLYDIDRLINRTVVYGSLTALLAGLYAASMRLFQATFVALTGDESDTAIVLTTLVLATTLTPLKGRLEALTTRVFGDAKHADERPSTLATASATSVAAPSGAILEDPAFQDRLDELAAQAVRRALAHGDAAVDQADPAHARDPADASDPAPALPAGGGIGQEAPLDGPKLADQVTG